MRYVVTGASVSAIAAGVVALVLLGTSPSDVANGKLTFPQFIKVGSTQ